MKRYKTKDLVLQVIFLLIPLVIYAVYKNGYLLYKKKLINIIMIFKPIYLVVISIFIKIVIDLIRYKKIKIDYNLLYLILVSMIVPYNINILLYFILVLILYIISLFLEKYIKYNKVCFIYLIIILVSFLLNNLTFKTLLEENYAFSFSFMDLLLGRGIGGISSTNILFSLIAYMILFNNFYYKKDIPLAINISYLLVISIYYLITKNIDYFLNYDLVFGSIFIATLPLSSPYKEKKQIIIGILIGLLSGFVSIYFNSVIAIYISIFIFSLLPNIKWLKLI